MARGNALEDDASELLARVLDASGDAFFVSDRAGRILRVNAAACRLTGYDESTLLALQLPDLVPKDKMEEHLAVASRLLEGEASAFTTERLHADGRRVFVRIAAEPLRRDGEVVGACVVVREVPGGGFLQALVESSLDAVVGLDTEGLIRLWNEGAERLYGWTPEEVLGRPVASLDPRPPGEVGDELRRALGGQRLRLKGRRRRKDGSLADVELLLAPVFDAEGRTVGVASVDRDLSERQRLEVALQRSERLSAMGQLAGGVVHDVNNLLTVIGMHTELALRSLAKDRADVAELDVVLDAVERGAKLPRSLLTFARRGTREDEVIDVRRVIENLAPLLRRALGGSVDLRLELGETSAVRFGATQLDQVITNLALNARDALGPGGGGLTIETRNVRLDSVFAARHPGTEPGRYVRLSVHDEGEGMDEATMARVFEPFFTTKVPSEGTGLGRATVYGLVKQAGGEVTVFSEPGHGTTFRVFLPRSTTPAPAHPKEDEPSMTSVTEPTETVLVLVADAALRGAVRRTLRAQGYEVIDAEDGAAAVARLADAEAPLDAVLSERSLSGVIDAASVTASAAARNAALGHAAPRLLYLGGARDGATSDAPQLPKPFTGAALLTFLRECLDEGR